MKNPIGTKLKTNMPMIVKIDDDFSIHVSHKDGMCDLKEVFDYGNRLRKKSGKHEIRMNDWLGRENTCEFIQSLEKMIYTNSNCAVLRNKKTNRFQVDGDVCSLKTARGKYGITHANLLLTIKAAAALDTDLEVLIYITFITQGILVHRDNGGDSFKRMIDAIDNHMPGREGKSSNRGLYCNVAKKIKKGLKCESYTDWNVEEIDAEIHKQRTEVEERIISFLENGFVNSTAHLWELIEKQCKIIQGVK